MPPLCRKLKKFLAADDPLSPAELAFRKLLEPVTRNGRQELSAAYVRCCRKARARWELEHPEHTQRVMDKRFR